MEQENDSIEGTAVIAFDFDIPQNAFRYLPVLGRVAAEYDNETFIVDIANSSTQRIRRENVFCSACSTEQDIETTSLKEYEIAVLSMALEGHEKVHAAKMRLRSQFPNNEDFTPEDIFHVVFAKPLDYTVKPYEQFAMVFMAYMDQGFTILRRDEGQIALLFEGFHLLRLNNSAKYTSLSDTTRKFCRYCLLRLSILTESLASFRRIDSFWMKRYIEVALYMGSKQSNRKWKESIFTSGLLLESREKRTTTNENLLQHIQIALRKKRPLRASDIDNFLYMFGMGRSFELNFLRVTGTKRWEDETGDNKMYCNNLIEIYQSVHETQQEFPRHLKDTDDGIRVIHDLPVYCIDTFDNIMDPDDGFSIDVEQNILHVHITDVTRYLSQNSSTDNFLDTISKRHSSVYTPFLTKAESTKWHSVGDAHALELNGIFLEDRLCHVLPLFPADLTGKVLSLGAVYGKNDVIIFSFKVASDGEVTGTNIFLSNLTHIHKLSYSDAEKILGGQQSDLSGTYIADLRNARNQMQKAFSYRTGVNSEYQLSASHMVQELMISANMIAARFCHWHKIPVIYRGNEKSGAVVNCLQPLSHDALFLPQYCQVTSPIRRAIDLENHINIKSFLRHQAAYKNMHQYTEINYLLNSSRIVNIIDTGKEREVSHRMAMRRIDLYRTLKRVKSQRLWNLDIEYVGKLEIRHLVHEYSIPEHYLTPIQQNGEPVFYHHAIFPILKRSNAPDHPSWKELDKNY
ncbi:VacB/RNB family exoribonuclease [Gracilaria domingensis]|nr:VacB/RNB family exoribonuclease [Gracilaria domingensis]